MTHKKDGHRATSVRVKTARGRKISSTRWLQRQLNDPYVQRAKKEGYASRAAYKLLEMEEKFRFLKPSKRVLDLGAAPGGWSQVAAQKTRAGKGPHPPVLAIDLKPMEPLPGVESLVLDFMEADAPEVITKALGGPVDVVLSDMAPNASGHAPTDHIRIMALCEAAYEMALEVLAPGGVFVCKVLKGGTEQALLTSMKQHFTAVRHAKPAASRKGSAEAYVVAMGFRQGVSG